MTLCYAGLSASLALKSGGKTFEGVDSQRQLPAPVERRGGGQPPAGARSGRSRPPGLRRRSRNIIPRRGTSRTQLPRGLRSTASSPSRSGRCIPSSALRPGPGPTPRLERIFRRFEPDIVHIQNQFIVCNGCLKQGRKSGIPVVGTNHFMPENVLPYFPKPFWPVMSPILWKHCLRVYNRLDCVLAPSKSCLNVLREAGLTAPARVISNGIDLQRFSGMASPGSISRSRPDLIYEKYGIRRDVPTFLAVGRLDKRQECKT